MTRQGLVKCEQGGNVTLSTIALANVLGFEIADLFPRNK